MTLSSARFAGDLRLDLVSRNDPAMRKGESGEPVRLVQQTLVDVGFPLPKSTAKHGTVDGIFGQETKDQVAAFQVRFHLTDDGVVGKNTITKMDEIIKLYPRGQVKPPPLPTSDDDRARDLVAATLLSSHARSIEFSLFQGTIHAGSIGRIGQFVDQKKIHVRLEPALLAADVGARYVGASNVLGLAKLAATNATRAKIVHEAVHASFDLRMARLPAIDEEAIAYVAQCSYLQRVTGNDTLPSAAFSWRSIAEHAWPIARKKRAGTYVDRADYDRLLSSVRAHYGHLDDHVHYVHDGVR